MKRWGERCSEEPRMIVVSFRIPRKLQVKLQKRAIQEGIGSAVLARKILMDYLKATR